MKKVIFVGQAMPRVKRNPHDWPTLNKWLYKIGLSDEDIQNNFCYTALVDYFPGAKNGAHLVPTKEEIEKEKQRLRRTINDFKPDMLVTIGKLSLENCLNIKVNKLDEYIGKAYNSNPYNLYIENTLIIPLPHPSGASLWYKSKDNALLLENALGILKQSLDSK